MAHKPTWITYIERKYGALPAPRDCPVSPDLLKATQSEIELIKYRMVREERFRAGQAILVYRTMSGHHYVIDGHTRARVAWEASRSAIAACMYVSHSAEADAEVARMAAVAGGGTERHVSGVPIIDRLGEGTEAWNRRRDELLDKARADESP